MLVVREVCGDVRILVQKWETLKDSFEKTFPRLQNSPNGGDVLEGVLALHTALENVLVEFSAICNTCRDLTLSRAPLSEDLLAATMCLQHQFDEDFVLKGLALHTLQREDADEQTRGALTVLASRHAAVDVVGRECAINTIAFIEAQLARE